MDERIQRMAENEARFRAMNEHNVGAADRFHGDGAVEDLEIMCECSSATCTSMFVVARDVYADVRAHQAWFLVTPGHESPIVEKVVNGGDGYVIVEKSPDAAEAAANRP